MLSVHLIKDIFEIIYDVALDKKHSDLPITYIKKYYTKIK